MKYVDECGARLGEDSYPVAGLRADPGQAGRESKCSFYMVACTVLDALLDVKRVVAMLKSGLQKQAVEGQFFHQLPPFGLWADSPVDDHGHR